MLHETEVNNPDMMSGQPKYSHFIDNQKRDVALFKMSKFANLDVKDAAYLYIVHILPHPTSHATIKST